MSEEIEIQGTKIDIRRVGIISYQWHSKDGATLEITLDKPDGEKLPFKTSDTSPRNELAIAEGLIAEYQTKHPEECVWYQ